MTASYSQDPDCVKLLQELSVDPQSRPSFTLCSGLIRYQGRVRVGSDAAVQRQIISALHDSAIGGHSGFPATYSRIKQLFAWKGMKSVSCLFLCGFLFHLCPS
jgi:hypothetical protein